MNIYYVFAIIFLVGNAILMLMGSRKDQVEAERKFLKNLGDLDSAQKEAIFRKLDLSEGQVKRYLTALDSGSRARLLKDLLPEFEEVKDKLGYSVEEVKQHFETLDDQSRKILFDQIKPEFEEVKGRIKESEVRLSNELRASNEWELTEKLKGEIDLALNSAGISKTSEISIAFMQGNEPSYKMAHYLETYLIEKGYNAKITGLQMVYNDYGIHFESKPIGVFFWVGRKPTND